MDPTRFAEDVEHGGVSEVVVFEAFDVGSPVEKEPSFLHGRVGFQDAVDYVRVPFDAEIWELGASGFPGGVLEDVVDVGYCVSCVNLGFWGLGFDEFWFSEEAIGVVSGSWSGKRVE